jgi:glutaredoxin
VAAIVSLAGCRERAAGEGARAGGATAETAFVAIRIDASRTDLLFTFVDDAGRFRTVSRVADVPEPGRERVTVTDLALTPEQRQSDAILYVADLRAPLKDGTYSYTVMSRYGFEASARERSVSMLEERATRGDAVVLYGTTWCGACKAARRFLQKKGVPFLDKDIEKDPRAEREMLMKAHQSGVAVQGVPVLDVYGTLVTGFDEARLEALLAAPRGT